ncbi:probable asparagine--tRNA ligase, mitochondrial [Condylostylus longicornis]|uniref:probable asparagine--tRNA ligase, mitochondrial n=1 Tax=Condylostylus longicornis TaxID=2530218 RepID=UPI00244E0C59|nr:probable asparagine--tRNA ligase, mitochondrial [Condylostylus longicornis]
MYNTLIRHLNFFNKTGRCLRYFSCRIENVKDLQETDNKIKIKHISLDKVGSNLTVKGWVQNIRKMKKDIFFDIDDGSTCKKFQVIIPKSEKKLHVGQSIEAQGLLQINPKNELELKASSVKILGNCNISDGVYPFTPKQVPDPEYVRSYLHIRTHVNFMRSVFRIRHHFIKIIHDFMYENDFIQISTPILTTNDCEGGGEIFLVKPNCRTLLENMKKQGIPIEESYFDKKTFLSVSGQLHLEAMCHGLGDTYTLTPAFRAENSKSPLHLSEFYMFEAELAFCDHIEILTNFIEKMIKTVTERLTSICEEDILNCRSALGLNNINEQLKYLEQDFKIMDYSETLRILAENREKFKTELDPEGGLSKEQELLLVELMQSPIFIINWPKTMKPFYMRIVDNDPFKVSGVDLLMPKVGELVGGSLRENDYETLKERLPVGLEWYLELRKYGSIPTGGFGLGLERFLQLITGIKNIRDVINFPRYPHSCKM